MESIIRPIADWRIGYFSFGYSIDCYTDLVDKRDFDRNDKNQVWTVDRHNIHVALRVSLISTLLFCDTLYM